MNSNGVIGAYSPPFRIVNKYFISATISFVLLTLAMVVSYQYFVGHHFQPRILAITHIATLGWITMILIGALFQLVPVVLEVSLWSEDLAEIQFWIYLIGTIGLIYGFWVYQIDEFFILSAALLNLAMLIFIINISVTLFSVKQWNLTGFHIVSALYHLSVTAVAGILMAINLWKPYIKIDHLQYLNLHAHVAFVGWVTMIIMGVSYKLIPMFTLAHGFSLALGKWSFWLINIGLQGIMVVMHFEDVTFLFYIFSLMIAIGLMLYVYQIGVIFDKRLRTKNDVGITFSIIAFGSLSLTVVIGIIMTFIDPSSVKNLSLVYGFMIIFPFLSLLIMGQMYKIVPFLVWFHKYSDLVGLQPVPKLKDLFDEKYAKISLVFGVTGMTGSILSLFSNMQSPLLFFFILLFISSLLFSYSMIQIYKR